MKNLNTLMTTDRFEEIVWSFFKANTVEDVKEILDSLNTCINNGENANMSIDLSDNRSYEIQKDEFYVSIGKVGGNIRFKATIKDVDTCIMMVYCINEIRNKEDANAVLLELKDFCYDRLVYYAAHKVQVWVQE